jgi:large subunit ribosomal protein L25
MKLNLIKRTGATKGDTNRIRREGDIPAVLYGKGHENQLAAVKGMEFHQILRTLPKGRLATSTFEISLDGVSHKAIVKNISYHPTTYRIEHLDFLILADDRPVMVNVPIEVVGVADCPGIKLGGTLRQVARTLAVSCLPRDIPAFIEADVRELGLEAGKRLSDLPLPANVRPLARMNELAVVIAKAKKA